MKAIFLTSNLGSYKKIIKDGQSFKEVVKCNNSNHFIDRLKAISTKYRNLVFIASDPDGSSKTDEYSNIIFNSLNLDDFEIKSLTIIDHRFPGNIEQAILSADLIFLAGGNVPMQNNYFKEINLKEILNNYNGVLIGQSAGSMNCSKIVYTQPEDDEEFDDPSYNRQISGLGLVDFAVMPHMNIANEVDEKGHPSVMQMCLEDSYTIHHYGICDYGFIEISGGTITAYGKTFLIKDGKCIEICADNEHISLSDSQYQI